MKARKLFDIKVLKFITVATASFSIQNPPIIYSLDRNSITEHSATKLLMKSNPRESNLDNSIQAKPMKINTTMEIEYPSYTNN